MGTTLGQLTMEPWGPIETGGFWDGGVFVCGRLRSIAADDPTRIIMELGPARPERPPQPAASAIRPTDERRNNGSRSHLRARPRGELQLPEIVRDVLRASWVSASELDEVPVNGGMCA